VRILFVTPYPLSRIRSRSYGFVTQLSKQHSVTVLALCAGQRDVEDVKSLQQQGIAITAVHEKPSEGYLRGLRALGSRLPLQVAYAASPALRTVIEAYLASGRFDLIHVESVRGLGALPEELPIPCVWDAVDCISNLYEQGAKVGATPLMRTLGRNEARRVQIYERENLCRFRQVLVTSERERQALLKVVGDPVGSPAASREPAGLVGSPPLRGPEVIPVGRATTPGPVQPKVAEITVLPHGIDREYYRPYAGPRLLGTLVFSGKMSFHANVAGVLHLIERILPRVWEKRADVRLILAGSDPPPILRRLAAREPRIELTGYVPDLRSYIARAQIAVSSLPYAVGLQNKVLEAMALGTPAIVTSHVASGLQPLARSALLVADGEEAFAAAILRLLDDQLLWNKLAEQGLAYIAMYHNWEHIIKQLTLVYDRAIRRGSLSAFAPPPA